MTDATVSVIVEELQKLNPEKREHIKVGHGIDKVIYTGGDPRELITPYPFNWDEEHHGFSDLQVLRELGMMQVYQLFTVSMKDN